MADATKHRLDISTVLNEVLEGRLDDAAAYRRIYQAEAQRRRSDTAQPAEDGRYDCPVCGCRGKAFLPFGLANRRNARCPSCDSLERHRLLWLFLQASVLDRHRQDRVLHIAPEPCLKAPMRRHWGNRLTTLDLSDPGCDIAGDLCRLPFCSENFNLLLCSHVLEHIPNDHQAMAEIARVTAPGGRVLIMVPLDPTSPTDEDKSLDTPAKRLERYGHPFHYRIYGSDITAKLAAHGLDATILHTRDIADDETRKRYRLNRNHVIDCRRGE